MFAPTTSLAALALVAGGGTGEEPLEISGVYPHLAVFNSAKECGIGAVVPWAGRLWFVTYSPHAPAGSDDGLYSIDREFRLVRHPESVGGTPANRMIHEESGQLVIGPYFIDGEGEVRVVPPAEMPGRLTGTARHLTDPANLVYVATMEEGLYEVDVRTLEVTTLFADANGSGDPGGALLPGYHGKGLYSGQGRLLYSNNGEYGAWRPGFDRSGGSGCLAEWDGREWSVVRRDPFTEVTGPGGIHGNRTEEEPLWALGWDHRSVLLLVLDDGEWSAFRLPKASHTYDGDHGWFTEWPRIRSVGQAASLMTMHGMLWIIPPDFSVGQASGIRPLASYLRVFGDLCMWRGRIVFGCDDGDLLGGSLNGQSQSNLWFVRPGEIGMGPRSGRGGVWIDDDVAAGTISDPYLVAGFERRMVHLAHRTEHAVEVTLEIDEEGTGDWREWKSIELPPRGYRSVVDVPGEWVRARVDQDAHGLTVAVDQEGENLRPTPPLPEFESLARIDSPARASVGVIRARGDDLRTLHFAASTVGEDGVEEVGYFEAGADVALRPVDDPEAHAWLKRHAAIDEGVFEVDAASVIVRGEDGTRYRLPRGPEAYDELTEELALRAKRDVVTERSLLHARGTFYELPDPLAGGVAKLRPIATHDRLIADFCSWRGLLVLAGVSLEAEADGHAFFTEDRSAALWFGVVDDLWGLGRPTGVGGPWLETAVVAGEASDPYLLRGYEQRSLEVSHLGTEEVSFVLEIDLTGEGYWVRLAELTVAAGVKTRYRFDDSLGAYWARLVPSQTCTATARFLYR